MSDIHQEHVMEILARKIYTDLALKSPHEFEEILQRVKDRYEAGQEALQSLQVQHVEPLPIAAPPPGQRQVGAPEAGADPTGAASAVTIKEEREWYLLRHISGDRWMLAVLLNPLGLREGWELRGPFPSADSAADAAGL